MSAAAGRVGGMSAVKDAREALEAAAWRATSPADEAGVLVKAVLVAADAYASAFGADLLDGMVRTRRTSDRRDAIGGTP